MALMTTVSEKPTSNKNGDLRSEIHLFVIWSKAMSKVDEIISKINLRFDILDIFLLHWSPSFFSNNLSRFYGTNLPDGSFKEKHCGRGNFCLIVVRDSCPVYDICQTSAGKERVNTNMFHAKQLFRSMTGGGHRIHATNTPAETEHDLMLLLERDTNYYLDSPQRKWDGQVEPVERDLPGAGGWHSIEQLFRVLNATTSYMVLRNFEHLPAEYFVEDHGDIDILCSKKANIVYLCNAEPVFEDPRRVLHKVKIRDKQVLFDFRHIGDDYYDIKWQKDLLKNRELSKNCFYRPCKKDYFYSLLYHAVVHKAQIKRDYIKKLCFLSSGLENLLPVDFNHEARIKAILDKFLTVNGYRYTVPQDLSVYFNNDVARIKKLSLERILSTSISPGAAILRILQQCNNRSTTSREFSEQIHTTHPSLKRHFSSLRYAFMESLPFEGVNHVLEVGAGSGVLTRYLGERFKSVIAVENDIEFAECSKLRCNDLATVSVLTSLEKLPVEDIKFDLIILTCDCRLLVPTGMTIENLTTLIRKTIMHLEPGGLFMLFIDNPLSHAGMYSSGPAINSGGKASTGALRSLHISDLKNFLLSNGLANLRACYMFPDHINPKTIFSDEAESSKLRAFGYWAASALEAGIASGYDLISAAELSHAGRLGDMAGGVCIMATHSECKNPEIPWLVFSLCNTKRPPVTQTITKVPANGDLKVVKEGQKFHDPPFIFDPNMNYPVYEGFMVDAILASNILSGNLNRVIETFQQLIKFWLDSFEWQLNNANMPMLTVSDDRDLCGGSLDAIPRNLIFSNGKLKFFDNEWKSSIPLPLSYLLYRSILNLFWAIKPGIVVQKLFPRLAAKIKTTKDLILVLINQINYFSPLSSRHILFFHQFENRFQQFAFNGTLAKNNPSLLELYQMVKIDSTENELVRMHQTEQLLNKYYNNLPEVESLRASMNFSGHTNKKNWTLKEIA
jgi:SAM-dependent methyltransferase